MAVINTADDVLTHPLSAADVTGLPLIQVTKVIAIAAADDDGSKYFIAELPDTAILESITLESPAITGMSVADVGIYDCAGNAILAAVFASNLDMTDVTNLPVGPLGETIRQAMTALALTDAQKKLYELAGHVNKPYPASGETQRKAKYRIVLTADTAATAAGTIVARVKYRNAA